MCSLSPPFGEQVYTSFPQHISQPATFFKVSWFNFDFDEKCITRRGRIDHFTVVCSVAARLWATLFQLIQNSLILLCKSSCSQEVCIKARPPPASLAFLGKLTKHTNVKWRILDQTKNSQTKFSGLSFHNDTLD